MSVVPQRSDKAAAKEFDSGEIVDVDMIDGCRLAGRLWRAHPGAPLFVAVHGVMSHSLWFQELADPLRRAGISLLAVDRRGAGMNRLEPGESPDDLTLIDDLDVWLDFASTVSSDIHLVGFCWGANYALHYIGRRRDRVRSLILMAPGIVPAERVAIRRSVDDLAPETQLPIPLALEDFTRGSKLESFLRPDPLRLTHTSARFVRIQNAIGRWSAVRLVRLRLPLLMILAAEDRISDNVRTRELFAKTSAAPNGIVDVPGGHGLLFDAPAETASACSHWLNGLAGL